MANDINIITNELYPTVEKSLKNKNTEKELFISISKYFDRNSDILYDTGLTNKLFFLDTDKEAVFTACGLDKSRIKTSIKKSKYIKGTWKILNEPLNIAFILIIRYYTIKKDKDKANTVLMFYACYFYSSLYFKYFPYGAKKEVMDYTINNLSRKFKIKQNSSVFVTINDTSSVSHDKYIDELIRGEDGDYATYISALKVRLNDLIKNIKNEYTNNYNANKFMNTDADNYDEDNYHIADNTSYIINRLANSTVSRLNTYGPDLNLAKLAANLADVSVNEIRNVVSHLSSEDSDNIYKITDIILQLYLSTGNSSDDIRGKNFIAQCIKLYQKSNTSDKLIIEMKEILDKWLNKFSDKYKKFNSATTIGNFRKAIFLYFAFQIQASSR